MVKTMSDQIPPASTVRRAASVTPRRSGLESSEAPQEVINDAPLQTIQAHQTNQVSNNKAWLQGYNMSEDELMALTVKKSFNLPLLLQAKMDYYLDEQRKNKRGAARNKLNETEVIKLALNAYFKSEFKKLGIDQ